MGTMEELWKEHRIGSVMFRVCVLVSLVSYAVLTWSHIFERISLRRVHRLWRGRVHGRSSPGGLEFPAWVARPPPERPHYRYTSGVLLMGKQAA